MVKMLILNCGLNSFIMSCTYIDYAVIGLFILCKSLVSINNVANTYVLACGSLDQSALTLLDLQSPCYFHGKVIKI